LNRKLLALNLALGAGLIYGGIELRDEWIAAKARQAKMPGPAPKAPYVAPVAPLKSEPAVAPSGYVNIATQTLFDPSRNPNLPAPPPPPPPPPADPPPLPSFHGTMDFGDPQGPVALITEADVSGHEEKHAGEMIGAFKLVAFDRKEMTLEWQGRTIHKRLNEGGGEKPKARAQAGSPELVTPGIIPGVASQQVEQPKQQLQEMGPGVSLTDTVRACQPGDGAAAGTVTDGYRKEVNINPMGAQCLWRAVGK
jgi:hypothetical protein